MTQFVEHWAGVCLGGEYTLERYLHAAGDAAAWFEAARGPEKVLLKAVAAKGSGGRLDLWRRTAYLQHPHLLQLLGCGRDDAAGGDARIYAAFEWPDETLAAAPVPLSEDDAHEMLAAALDALRYLHAQGLVHGSIDATSVVAAGNTVKLSTDDLHEPDSDRYTYAADVGALGALLYWALTGRKYDGGTAVIPEPFASIVRNTAGADPADRWRIPEIVTALAPLAKAASAAPGPSQNAPAHIDVLPPLAADPIAGPVVPMLAAESGAPPAMSADRPASPRIPVWAWPLSLAAIAACFMWVFHTPERKPQVPSAPVSVPEPAVPVPAAAPDPAPPIEAAAPQTSRSGERTVWRVIAYTYNALRDAKKKALAINKRWPGINAEVFAPKGEDHPPFLVAIGGRMSRMEAARVLQKARSRGLPRDTFMLNFSD
jgi:hypothetical protein